MKPEKVSGMMDYEKRIYIRIILVILGVILMNTSSVLSIGVVFIAIGSLFFIAGITRKKMRTKQKFKKEIL